MYDHTAVRWDVNKGIWRICSALLFISLIFASLGPVFLFLLLTTIANIKSIKHTSLLSIHDGMNIRVPWEGVPWKGVPWKGETRCEGDGS